MRTNQTFRAASFGLILLAINFGIAPKVEAQIPDKFENLRIYPKNISKQELIGDMRTFALGLGVRCSYCHVGDESKPLPEDFASDAKETKKIARIMLRMRDNLNQNYLSQIAAHRASTVKIQCVTCHHEQANPMTIEEVVVKEVESNGLQAAIAKYRELREKYYGGFVYNFQDRPLTNVASQLGRSDKLDEAVAILKLNLEFHPNSFITHFGLGQGFSQKGDKKGALKHFNKAYEIQPNPRIKQQIDKLSGN
jgi:tetratricopeptide (TPR) repeat protein